MLVRAKRTHFNGSLRVEGAEFNHEGPLHEHIEPVSQKGQQPAKAKSSEGYGKSEE